MKVPPHEFVRWYFFCIIPLGCPVLEQPKVHYAQKIGMICERLMKNIKKIVWTNFFDKTLLTMIIINNIICSGNDNQFQIMRGNIYEPRREISRSIKSIKEIRL